MQPGIPTIVLIGGPFTTDTGEKLDSRQPFDDDPLSYKTQTALAGSELWWRTTTSLVIPLLSAQGGENFAMISGPRSIVEVKADGGVRRLRLASLLPGGVRPKKPDGRWQLIEMAYLSGQIAGQPPPSFGGPMRKFDATVIVETDGWYWRNAMAKDDYVEFERSWLTHEQLVIVVPHTHAATVYLDGYTNWVAAGRKKNAQGPPPTPDWDYYRPTLHAVVPVEADFRLTAVLQNGTWVDPAPLEAARALIQTRFDLKLGIWDLVTNHTLRATLLKETPAIAPPKTPAAATAGDSERQRAWRASIDARAEAEKRREAYYEAVAALVGTLDATGWTSQLPGELRTRYGSFNFPPSFRFNPTFGRFLPLAVGLECDYAEIRTNEKVWSGRALLWLQLDIEPNPKLDSAVRLVVSPTVSSFEREMFEPFITKHTSALEEIARPIHSEIKRTHHDDGRITYDLAVYAGQISSQISDFVTPSGLTMRTARVDWEERVSNVARMMPAWLDLLAPLAKRCQEAVMAHPLPGGERL